METPYGEVPDRLAAHMHAQETHDYLAARYSRRTVLTAAALGGATAVAGPMLWRQGAASASALPIGPRWINFGADPTTQMTVSWSAGSATRTGPGPAKPRVRYGLDKSYGATGSARSQQVPVPSSIAHEPVEHTYYQSLGLTGLQQATTYHYSVSNDGSTWSPDAVFTTAATGLPGFRFTAFGDQGTSTATMAPMAKLVAAQRPAFHLVCGDLAYAQTAGGSAPPTTAQFHPGYWDTYLANIAPAASSVPWHPSVGAHETEPLDNHGYAGFLARFPQAYDLSSGSPVVRSWTYGNVGFVQLDGNDMSAQETANTGYSQGGQTSWLASVLARFRTAGSGVDFIVAVCNCCLYSSNTNHGSDGGLRDAWGPLFDQYQVDLVLSGHVHAYERTNPIRAAQVTRQAPAGSAVAPQQDGTTYICAGGGGNTLYKTWYGSTLSGDAGSATGPKIWRWSGGDTAAGGSGRPVDSPDTVTDFSACRRAVYSCVVIDVTPPALAGDTTTMGVKTVMPSQSASSVTSIANPTVIDSVVLQRTTSVLT